jgi:YfiH family protein
MAVGNKGLRAGIVQVSEWEPYLWLRHGFSTREGGVSSIYGRNSLNLGWTKDDEPALVAENRRRFLQAVYGDLEGKGQQQAVTVKQVHSNLVRVVRVEDGVWEGRLQTADGKAVMEGDGLMTSLSGVMLGVQAADCVPVLVVDVEKRAVAAFHAGWRGTVAQIVERGIERMRTEFGSRVEDLVAAVGPSIGTCCYAVGEDVRSAFGLQFRYAEKLFRESDRAQMHLDLWEANRRQLLDAGVGADRITVVGECTACALSGGERKYFSHRAEHGFTGRMMNVVGVV